jgi:uncharacterized protein YndB with AHSA1/START domain
LARSRAGCPASPRPDGRAATDCTLEDGGEIREGIADFSDERRRFTYEQTVHPRGFKSSVGALAVEPRGNGASRVVWNAELEFADPAQETQFIGMLEQGYAGALERLKEVVES